MNMKLNLRTFLQEQMANRLVRDFACWLPLVLLFSTPIVQSEPRVIADFGGESAVRFYEPIQPVHSADAPKHPDAVPATLDESAMLPVVSHKWTVGKVEPRKLELIGASPLFLVGTDDTSLQWLHQNKERLKSMSAVGLVINVNTLAELNTLRASAPELELLPAPADSLAERLGIYHYPVIIHSEGISQ